MQLLNSIPNVVKPFYKDLVFDYAKTADNAIYLTFDDGPVPGITDWLLDLLKLYQVKASFFCLGKQVARHPDLFLRIIEEGHLVGNHSYSHPNGWLTANENYLADVAQAEKYIRSKFFRPPYGKISRAQAKMLKNQYKIIMYSLLSGDYKSSNTPDKCTQIVLKTARAGSIIVYHDSQKAENNMKKSLENCLPKLLNMGFQFGLIH